MNKTFLKTILADQSESMKLLLNSDKMIAREGTASCIKFLNAPNILLITGMRRSGKSVFSQQIMHPKNYPFINFDDERLISFKTEDFKTLLECFYEMYGNFDSIIFDEIQNIYGWELFVNRLRNQYKIIITGSNAQLLSSEMSTHLTGRFVSKTLFPMNFSEFCKYKRMEKKRNDLISTRAKSALMVLFEEYCMRGGIFENYLFGSEFIRTLFSSIIHKDIVARYGIKHPSLLEEFSVMLVNYFTSRISLNKISHTLKVKSSHTLASYTRYLEKTYLIFTLNKFSYKLKEQLSTLKKVYIVDNGLIQSLLFDFSENKGKLLENLVAIELKKKCEEEKSSLFYWDENGKECDFIILKNRKISAIYQVCSHIHPDNRERETNGLLAAMNYFSLRKGFILTWDEEDSYSSGYNKIYVIPVWKWLLRNDH